MQGNQSDSLFQSCRASEILQGIVGNEAGLTLCYICTLHFFWPKPVSSSQENSGAAYCRAEFKKKKSGGRFHKVKVQLQKLAAHIWTVYSEQRTH
jgi:hypothetical protein